MHMAHLSNKEIGTVFETLIEGAAIRKGMGCQKVKNTAFLGGKFQSIKAPYDKILFWKGRAAPIDAKSFDRDRLKFSDLTKHQVDALYYAWRFQVPAGYVVLFRPIDTVVFFNAEVLTRLQPNSTISATHGVILGTMEDFDLRKIFGVHAGHTEERL